MVDICAFTVTCCASLSHTFEFRTCIPFSFSVIISFFPGLRIQGPFRPWGSTNQGGGMCSDSESAGGSSESRSMDSPTASPGKPTKTHAYCFILPSHTHRTCCLKLSYYFNIIYLYNITDIKIDVSLLKISCLRPLSSLSPGQIHVVISVQLDSKPLMVLLYLRLHRLRSSTYANT